MSETLQTRAEILKLARLLRREPSTLQYMESVPSEDIAQLREQITETLFDAQGQVMSRLAAASRLLPVGVVATIGERAFGPFLSARVAGLLEPSRAVEMAARMPIDFLADIAVEIDPRRASAVISRIPPAQIAAVTRELLSRGEYVTMGRFVGHLREDSIAAAVGAMNDHELLQVAFVLESKDGVGHFIGLLSPERIDAIIETAASDDLWPEVLDLVSHLDDRQKQRLADAAAAREDGVLDTLITSAQVHDIWAAALPVTGAMSETSRRRFAELTAIQGDGVLERIVVVAKECQLWPQLLPLVPFLPEPALRRVGVAVDNLRLDNDELTRLAGAADDPELLEGLTRLVDAAGLQDRLAQAGSAR